MNSRTCVAATSIAAVDGLKDQGFARWSYAFRSLQQHANNNIRSHSQASSSVISNKFIRDEKMIQCEDSLKNVMYLNCWGPN
ncbi:putative cyclin-T1-1 [Bienertia sinuspersici]